jgi:hypothetical protein
MNIKNLIASTIIGFMAIGATLASTPIEVMLPIDDVYSPKGFDTNDNAQIVISGYLPNLCHKNPKAKVSVVGRKVEIKMISLKYDTSNPYCLEMIVPFVEAVDLGVLDKGAYDIVVNGKSIFESRANLQVSEAQSDAVDDHVYAAVEYIDKEIGNRKVVLKGYNPSDCFVLDNIKILDNEKNVYSILPKMKQISSHCPMKMMPFEYEVEVPSKLKADKVLLHVRSIEGKSVNSIFSNVEIR